MENCHKGSCLHFIGIDENEWLEFVNEHPDATLFHHPSWIRLLADCYGYIPFILVLKNEDGQISAGTPAMEINSWITGKRWVSLPFTDHCRLLLKNKDNLVQFTSELLIKSKETENMKIEIRHELPALNSDISKYSYYIHNLTLAKNSEEIFKRFRKKGVRYCIKKAERSGIKVLKSTTLESITSFYDLHCMTRKKLGVPTQPRNYFIKLWEHIIKEKMGFVMLAYNRDMVIAGGVFLLYNKKIVYKYGATDPRFMNLYANHLLLWETIKGACENGFVSFDWGRTDKDQDGLRNFKLGWGVDESELVYSYIGKKSGSYSTGWKQRIIEKTIKNSPVWVGRSLGELLYKHVG